jgi:hypothetical protein
MVTSSFVWSWTISVNVNEGIEDPKNWTQYSSFVSALFTVYAQWTPVHLTWGLLRVCSACPTPRLNWSSSYVPLGTTSTIRSSPGPHRIQQRVAWLPSCTDLVFTYFLFVYITIILCVAHQIKFWVRPFWRVKFEYVPISPIDSHVAVLAPRKLLPVPEFWNPGLLTSYRFTQKYCSGRFLCFSFLPTRSWDKAY